MALTSLKNEESEGLSEYRENLFGYGTEICLNDDQVRALGITDMAAGQRVAITAVGIVTSANASVDSDSDSRTGKELSLRIQLTDMSLRKSGTADAKRAASLLYDKS